MGDKICKKLGQGDLPDFYQMKLLETGEIYLAKTI